MNSRLAKPTTCSSRAINSVAIAMKLTISPTETSPLSLNQVPSTRITSSVSVVAVRVSTAANAHHDSTGICARRSEFTRLRRYDTSSSMRAKLCTTATLPSASLAVSATSE